MNLVKTGAIALRFIKRNSPFILSAAAGIGLIALYFLTIKETEKAQEVLNEAEEEEVHSFKMAKRIAKIYAPSFLCLVITMVCVISSAVISHHMIRDLTAYAAGMTAAYNQYRQHNIENDCELNGVDEDRMIIADIARNNVLDEPPDNEEGYACLINGYPHFFRVPNLMNIYAAILELDHQMEAGDHEWINFVDFWKKARVMDRIDHKYLGHGWTSYDLTKNYGVSSLYPNGIYKETDDSGFEWYMIDLPMLKPMEI